VPKSGEEDEEALAFLAARDTDGFNRWEAGQKLMTSVIFQTMEGTPSPTTYDYVKDAFKRSLTDDKSKDFSIIAYALTLPSEGTLAEFVNVVDPIAIKTARGAIKQKLAREFQTELQERYDDLTTAMDASPEFNVDAESIGRRRLRNVCLDYLSSIRDTPDEQTVAAALAMTHFQQASGMTDKVAGLGALVSMDGNGAAARDEAIQTFFDDAKGDSLVLNKWFSLQAMADLPDVLDRVIKLKDHFDFTLTNPNRCRSLVGAFSMNTAAFHDESGSGYDFLVDVIAELDRLNPQISSRMAGSLISWRKYNPERGALMKKGLEKLAAMTPISDDMFEIVSRGLKE
jgi:aminopeptidase N